MTESEKLDTEELTESERAMCIGGLGAKLLRIHDRLRAENEVLKRSPSRETEAALLMRERHALDRYRAIVIAWADQVRDLAPRVGPRALEGLPDDVKAVLAKNPPV